jgi:hypothetical protein
VSVVFHPSWPAPAQALLRRAIDRHGGWSLWLRLESVTVNLTSLRGFLPWLKGYGRSFQLGRSLTTFPKAGRTEWREESGKPSLAIFERGDVRLLDPSTGHVTRESRDHRRSFRGLRKARRWDAVDAHYFFGYAFASYGALPFVLPSVPFLGTTFCRWRGERMSGVRVQFPAEAQVHSREQAYFFDEDGLLRRNDYVADVIGSWAVGAHFCEDYTTVNGLPLPARRTVFRRVGGIGGWALPGVPALAATFVNFDVHLSDAPGKKDHAPATA